MKRIITVFTVLSVCLLFACDSINNSLELAPIDSFASGNFFNNADQVNGNMLGLHSDLRGMYQGLYMLGESRGGTYIAVPSIMGTSQDQMNPQKSNTFTKESTGISNWYGYYSPILKVNYFIERVENGCSFLSDAQRGRYLGQAYGIRAYYYFMLYRTYGGVPVIDRAKVILDGATSALDLYTPRSTPKQTLDFIKSDILKSDQYFGSDFSTASNAMWSKSATLMLKSEIFLWSGKVADGDQTPAGTDIQTAKDALSQLIGKYSLQPKFEDVFAYNNKENNETIFAFRFIEGEASDGNVGRYLYQSAWQNRFYSKEGILMGDTLDLRASGGNAQEYRYELFESFQPNDTRRDFTFLDFYAHDAEHNIIGKGLILKKNMGILNANGARVWATDIPLYRFADVLLMMAEVENKLGNDPSSYINQVRARAYGASYNADEHGHVNGDFEANELAILFERDKEFVYEGKRWFDIRRMQDATGRALVFSGAASYYGNGTPVLDYNTKAYMVLWPIDVTTLNNDPTLEQTLGY